MPTAEFFAHAESILGESPVWLAERDALAWVDSLANQVNLTAADGAHTRTYATPLTVGCAIPHRDGRLVLATGCAFATLDLDTGEQETLVTVPGDPEILRFNDGKADPAGRVLAGTMRFDEEPPGGTLHRLDPDGAVTGLLDGVVISNGLDWTADGRRMYHIDTPTRTIASFAYDLDGGALGDRQTFADTASLSGYPDGMTLDADGNLWVAFWLGGVVRCLSGEDGSVLDEIRLPVTLPTCPAFGGPGLRTLFITTAREILDDAAVREQPLAGSVFCVQPGVSGRPAYRAAVGG